MKSTICIINPQGRVVISLPLQPHATEASLLKCYQVLAPGDSLIIGLLSLSSKIKHLQATLVVYWHYIHKIELIAEGSLPELTLTPALSRFCICGKSFKQ